MGLVDALAAPPPPPAGSSKLDALLERLSVEDAAALRAALIDPRFSHAHLARVLTDNGHPTSEKSVRRWRDRNG